jgi:para-nitrobenzyl esterase
MSRIHTDPLSRRETRQGSVTGFGFDDETWAWWGIPYASPPVGPLRWRAPRPHPGWVDDRPCTRYGDMSLQLKSFMTNSPPAQWNKPIGSEDCLTLNVFAPRHPRTRALPVMVWIHGGGNTGGASSMYSIAGNLPAHHDVVVVTVNYRLGIFGWCHHPALFDDACSDEDRSGNFGTLDLIAALRWVRDNIGAFGGDRDNVTLFGESAGGQNVLSLYVSPLARGLFHKAIAQSPITMSVTPEAGWHSPIDAHPHHRGNLSDITSRLWVSEGRARSRNEALRQMQATPAEELRHYLFHKDADQIISMYNGPAMGIYESPRLFQDGHVLPSVPLLEALGDPALASDVPLIVGTNRDEMKLFMLMNPEYVNFAFGKLPLIKNVARYELDADYFSQMWKAVGVDEPLHRLWRSGRRNLWCYRFDWDEIPAVPMIRPDILIGATHALEIPFVMRDMKGVFNPFRTFTKRNQKSRHEVTRAMAGLWTGFAHHGAPMGDHLPDWHPWAPGKANTLVIDAEGSGGIRMEATDCSFEAIKSRLLEDRRLARKARDRLRLYVRMFMGSGLFGHHGSIGEYDAMARSSGLSLPYTAFSRKPLV